uniref:ascorbate ferrireductase (transmembrane) n=1 Tax=Heliothis virescens TaxID=7102 RepID=A0A2A4JR54_HELVI
MDVADRACDLECVGNKGKAEGPVTHEFVGPVRIVLVELSAADYRRKIWGSAVFTFIMMLIGVNVFTVFFFTLTFQLPLFMNLHVFLCTMGFQLFMPIGILMFSPLFGGSMYLTPNDRTYQHFILEIFAVSTGLAGTILSLGHMKYSCHAVTGFIGTVLAVLASLVGLIIYFIGPKNIDGQFIKETHRYLAISGFIFCTACFILGLLEKIFIKWIAIKNVHFILILFSVLYTLAAMMSTKLRTTYGT